MWPDVLGLGLQRKICDKSACRCVGAESEQSDFKGARAVERVLFGFELGSDRAASFGKILEGLQNLGCVGEAVAFFDLDSGAARIEYIDSRQFIVCWGAIYPGNERSVVPTRNSMVALAGLPGSGSKTLGRMSPPGSRARPAFLRIRAIPEDSSRIVRAQEYRISSPVSDEFHPAQDECAH
jgi:hypothetical protein